MPRRSAVEGVDSTISVESVSVRGVSPFRAISAVKLVRSASSRSIARSRTNVPLPRVLTILPSRTSSSSARRTVTRLHPKDSPSSRSVGSLSPGPQRPESISRRRAL